MYFSIIILAISACIISYYYNKLMQILNKSKNKPVPSYSKSKILHTTDKQAENFQELFSLYCTLESHKQEQYFKQLTKKTIIKHKQQKLHFKKFKLSTLPIKNNKQQGFSK